MNQYNFRFNFDKNVKSNLYEISIDINKNFFDILKSSNIDKQKFEDFSFDAIQSFGYKVDRKYFNRYGGLCIWEGNSSLIQKINLVGDSSMILNGNGTNHHYVSNNVKFSDQVASVYTIFSEYFGRIEDEIHNKLFEKRVK